MEHDVDIRWIEQELARLNEAAAAPGQPATLRTRVLTHVAWVPPAWEEAARAVLAGLGERHPSRTILLVPDPEADQDALDAEVDLRCFAGGGPERVVCSEVIAIRLRGPRASAPASVVQPLLVSDVPAFLRWRGSLPFGNRALGQLVAVADRLIVDSREWQEPAADGVPLAALFDEVAVSDIAWARLHPWRLGVARLWPAVAEAEVVHVLGPQAEALLLAGWLSSRLGRVVRLEHEAAAEVERVSVDGREARRRRLDQRTPSELLSGQLEIFGRDPIYEDAVRALAPEGAATS